MRGRRAKIIVRGVLLLAVLLGAGIVAGWRLLPGFVERQARAALRAEGIRHPALRVRALGWHAAEVTDFAAAGTNWAVRLDQARFHYRPLALLEPRLDRLDLDGLRVELAPFAGATGAPAPPAPPDTPLLAALPERLPVGQLRVTNGRLHLRHAGRTLALPFWLTLTNDPARSVSRLRLASRAPEQWLRLEGSLARHATSQISAAFALRAPREWFRFALGQAATPASLPEWDGPLAGTLTAEIAPDANTVSLRAALAPLKLARAGNRLTGEHISATAQAGRTGMKQLRLHARLGITTEDGWRADFPDAALSFTAPGRLELSLSNARANFGELARLAGNFRLAAADVTAGAAATGRLAFDRLRLLLPGMRVAPFSGAAWGGREQVAFQLPRFRVTNGMPWQLSEVRGTVCQPLSPRTRATVKGLLSVSWPAPLGPPVPLPFTLEMQRQGAGATGRCTLVIRGARPVFAGRQPGHEVTGRLVVTADYQPEPFHVGGDLTLAAPRVEIARIRAEAVTLDASARLTIFPQAGVPLPGLLRPLLESLPGWPRELPADGPVTLRLRARRLVMPGGGTLDAPELRLTRRPAPGGAPARWARLGFQATNWTTANWQLAAPRLEALLGEDRLTIHGGGTLAGLRMPFDLEVTTAPAEAPHRPAAAAGGWVARARLGPLVLRDFTPPAAWTGGSEFHVTGRVTLEARGRGGADFPAAGSGRLRLNLTRIECPGQKLLLEGLTGTLALASLDPLRSATNDCFTLRRLEWQGREITNLVLTLRCLPGARLRVQLVNANLFGGRVWSEPFRVDGQTGDLAVRLRLAGLDLRRLSREIPHWTGDLEGRIRGTLAVRRKNGHWQPEASRLELDPSVPARFQYPADGLLTASLAPDSPRYQQLKMVEEGLKDLTLKALNIDLLPPGETNRVARVRLEGVSVSDRLIVPVILTINVNGGLRQLLGMLERGNFEFSF